MNRSPGDAAGRGLGASLVDRLRGARTRRVAYAVAAALSSILVLFPRHYVARVQMLPQDESSAGLSAALGLLGGGLQNFAALIGTHQTTEVYLDVARSDAVARDVIDKLHLLGRYGFRNVDQGEVTLMRKVHAHTLAGGILEVEVKDRDPRFARQVAAAYTQAIESRVAALSRDQTAKKLKVVRNRFEGAAMDLAHAQAAMDQFRRVNKLAAPQAEFGAGVSNKVSLQGELQAKRVALQATEQFATPNNMSVQALKAQIAGLETAIAAADAGSSGNLESLASKSTEYMNLFRTEVFQEALFNIYSRALEQASVEDVSAAANTNVQVIEAPYLLPKRQYNLPAVGALIFIILLSIYTEWYIPMTGVGARRRVST